MKLLALLLLGAAVVVATSLHKRWLGPAYEHELGESVAGALAGEQRFRDVRVVMRQLDAVLYGEVDTPADRDAAQALANGIWGVRARAAGNRLRVRPRLDAIVEHDVSSQTALPLESVSIRGYLPENVKAEDLPAVFSGVSANRRISSTEVGYFAFVGALPKFDRAALAILAAEFSRLPSIGMLELNAQGILLSGDTFPTQKKRLEELAAAVVAAPAVVDSQLRSIDLTEPARQALRGVPGLEDVQVQFNEAYATLTGHVASPDLRLRAAKLVESVRLARLREDQNRITLGGSLTATVATEAGGKTSVLLSGLLPDEGWKTQLIASLGRLKPGWAIETASLRFTPWLTPAGWLDKERFFLLFDEFFGAPAPQSLRLDANGLILKAGSTFGLRRRFTELASGFGFPAIRVRGDYEDYVSVYDMPGYRRISKVPSAALGELESALKECLLHFEEGRAELSPAEAAKLDRLATVLRRCGEECWLVAGGVAEASVSTAGRANASETRDLARQRAENARQALAERGFAAARCQVEIFEDEIAVFSFGNRLTEEKQRTLRRVEILLR